MFILLKIMTIAILLSHARAQEECWDHPYMVEYKRKIFTSCAEIVQYEPLRCRDILTTCCASCKRVKDSLPNTPADCYGDRKVNDGYAFTCKDVAKYKDRLCSQRKMNRACCVTCARK